MKIQLIRIGIVLAATAAASCAGNRMAADGINRQAVEEKVSAGSQSPKAFAPPSVNDERTRRQ